MREWRPDVCFSHNMQPLEVDEGLASVCPVVKMMHGYFGTCISGQKAHAFPAVAACAREFGLACLGLYLPRRCGQLRPALMISQFGWASRQRGLFDRYAHVVVASRHMARGYARHGIRADRVTPRRSFQQRQTEPASALPPALPTVVFLGRMTAIKGGDVLIRAAAYAARLLAKPVRLAFAGNGPAEEPWRTLARERTSTRCSTGGWLEMRARHCSEVPVSSPSRVSGPSLSAWSVSRPPCMAYRRSASMSAASANGCAMT